MGAPHPTIPASAAKRPPVPIAPARLMTEAEMRRTVREIAHRVQAGELSADDAKGLRLFWYDRECLTDEQAQGFERYSFGALKAAPPGSIETALELVRRFEELHPEEMTLPESWAPRPRGSKAKPRLFFACLILGYRLPQFMLAENATAEAYARTFPGQPFNHKDVPRFWKAAQANGIIERTTPKRTVKRDGSGRVTFGKWCKAVFRLSTDWTRALEKHPALFALAQGTPSLAAFLRIGDTLNG